MLDPQESLEAQLEFSIMGIQGILGDILNAPVKRDDASGIYYAQIIEHIPYREMVGPLPILEAWADALEIVMQKKGISKPEEFPEYAPHAAPQGKGNEFFLAAYPGHETLWARISAESPEMLRAALCVDDRELRETLPPILEGWMKIMDDIDTAPDLSPDEERRAREIFNQALAGARAPEELGEIVFNSETPSAEIKIIAKKAPGLN